MVRILLVVEMSDPGDERFVAFLLGPFDSSCLGFGSVQHVIGVVLDNVVIDRTVFRSTLGTCFDIDVRHQFLRLGGLIARPFLERIYLKISIVDMSVDCGGPDV
jgi:hypothetical protein